MDDALTMSLDEVEALARETLQAAGAGAGNAASVARSTRAAERDCVRSHGLLYLPIYAEHLRCGKVDGQAAPRVSQPKPGALRVDAASGFAHPAIDAGLPLLVEAARSQGVAAMSLQRSYNCGILGHHAERLAEAGMLSLCFTNAPASIAPPGGRRPVIGTNPFAVGVPAEEGRAAFVIDQSASVVAKSEILLRARSGEPIEPHWALDREGRPTEDAEAALAGSMAPAGGHKGFGAGLMVELMAACLAGATLGLDASPFSGPSGGPPNTGQCFVAFYPRSLSGGLFAERTAALVQAIGLDEGARLPGERRRVARQRTALEGVRVPADLLQRIRQA